MIIIDICRLFNEVNLNLFYDFHNNVNLDFYKIKLIFLESIIEKIKTKN